MKHNYEQLLRYMHLSEKGYSAWSIHSKYGINNEFLKRYWVQYQKYGPVALHKKKRTVVPPEVRFQAISEFENNELSLREVLRLYSAWLHHRLLREYKDNYFLKGGAGERIRIQ